MSNIKGNTKTMKGTTRKKKKNGKRTVIIAIIAVITAALCGLIFWGITFVLQFISEKIEYCANAMLESYEIFGVLALVLAILFFKILISKPKRKPRTAVQRPKKRVAQNQPKPPVKRPQRSQEKPKTNGRRQAAHMYK